MYKKKNWHPKDIRDIETIRSIEAQMSDGYLDIHDIYDRAEFELISRLLSDYKKKFKIKGEN